MYQLPLENVNVAKAILCLLRGTSDLRYYGSIRTYRINTEIAKVEIGLEVLSGPLIGGIDPTKPLVTKIIVLEYTKL